jgi:hypothetical protein
MTLRMPHPVAGGVVVVLTLTPQEMDSLTAEQFAEHTNLLSVA